MVVFIPSFWFNPPSPWPPTTHTHFPFVKVLFEERGIFLLLLFGRPGVSDSLWPHGLQHVRLPCPSSSPRVCSNSCPLSWCCYPAILSSVVPFSSRLQSFPASGSFPVSWLFALGGISIGASASASVFPVNIQGWFPLGLTGLTGISLCYYWNSFRQNEYSMLLFFILNFLQVSSESLGNLWLWLPYFLLCFLASCISLSPKLS